MSNEIIELAHSGINAYNKANWDAVTTLMSADIVYDEVATHRKITGHDDVITAWKGWRAAFPDSSGEITSSRSDGDTAIIEIRWTGKHTGPMMTPNGEIPATNKDINLRAIQVTKVADGKIAHQTHYFCMATMMTQLGLA